MKKIFTAVVIIFALCPAVFAAEFDVAVIGGGCSGCAAAVSAARQGAKVILFERSEMLGGQMTASAVSTMDDRGFTRTGIYKEFIDNIRNFYEFIGKNVNTCYWGEDTIAFEPVRGAKILRKMAESAGVTVVTDVQPISVKTEDYCVKQATFKTEDGDKFKVKAKIFIDATECGDFISLTPARYRAGNSVSTDINKDGVIQDITYVAVVRKYPNGLPESLRIDEMPPNYDKYVSEFRSIVKKNGNSWPNGYPYNIATHNEYRGLPDSGSAFAVNGGEPSTWQNVTKTCLNWANDYPGMTYGDKQEHLSVRYLTDMDFREETNRRAMEKTLCFIYYMQHELGMTDWSVSNEGFTRQLTDWKQDEMLAPYAEILKFFPCRPYVRESRRIIGEKTVTVNDILRNPDLQRTEKSIKDAVILGEYPVDLHAATDDQYLEAELGETKASVPNDWHMKGGLFQLPMSVLIPEKINGLLAAEKNISVSRVANGSTRLQPITMLTGQAAGTLAGMAVKNTTQPRNVSVIELQKQLLTDRDKLSLYNFSDVPETDENWKYAELAMVYGCLEPENEKKFGRDEEINFLEFRYCLAKLTKLKNRKLDDDPLRTLTCLEAAECMEQLVADESKFADTISMLRGSGDAVLTKLMLAKIFWDKLGKI